jgi:putative NIF3 family GTP cyclohydrolase 1 type 2
VHVNASLDEIAAFMERLLDAPRFREREPEANGLIYRAGPGVSKFAVAVNTSLVTIVGAAKAGAQLLVVHHTTWSEIDLHLHEEKLQMLREAGLSLYAAHHSLDCAPDFGNAWALAGELGVVPGVTFGQLDGADAGVICPHEGGFATLVATASRVLGVQVEAHEHARTCARIAILPGGGGMTHWLDDARRNGADTYITGEGSMYTRMFAREAGMNLLFGTHHATEAPGIKALGERIAAETSLPWEFIAESQDVF